METAQRTPALAGSRQAWGMLGIVYLASAVAAFNWFKVPPLLPLLTEELALTRLDAGLLMSVFSLTGAVVSLPAGLLSRRLGASRVGLVALGCMALGTLLGGLAPTGQLLLATRVLEGVGLGTVGVLSIVVIAAWFPPSRRAVAIGVFSTWLPVGNVAALIFAPPVVELWGWRTVWFFGAGVAVLALAAWGRLLALPRVSAGQPSATLVRWSKGMGNPSAWLLCCAFACFQASRMGYLTWLPTYLVEQASWTLVGASQLVGTMLFITMPTALAAGWFVNLLQSRRKAYSLALALLAPGMGVVFVVSPDIIVLPILFTGVLAALVPPSMNTAAPETARDPSETGAVVGITSIGRNLGMVLGPAVLAAILQTGGTWLDVSLTVGGLIVMALTAGWWVRVK